MRSFSVLLLLPLLLVLGACNRDPKVVSRKYVENGNKYFEKEKFKEASLMYRQALAKDRLNGQAYYRLALTNLRTGDVIGAYRALLRAVDIMADKPEYQKEYLDALTKLADVSLMGYLADPKRPKQLLKDVESYSEKLLKLDANSFNGVRLKGYLALAEDKSQEALALFERANKIQPLQRDVVIVLIQILSAVDRFPEAEALWTQAIGKEKDKNPRPLYDIMYLEYMNHKRPADAAAVYTTAKKDNPKDSYYPIRLAAHALALRDGAGMEKALSEMTTRIKDYPSAYRSVGDFYFRIGQLDQALNIYDQGMKLAPADKALFQKRIIEIFVQQNKKAEASQLVEVLIRENPKDSEAAAIRAALVIETGNKDQINKAITDLQTALASMPKNPVLRFNLGRAYLAKGDLDQAKVQFQDAITERPDYIHARLALGQLFLLRSEFAAAQAAADEALLRAPANPVARLIRTSAIAALGNNAQARKELQELVKLYPNSRDAQFQLGMLSFQEKKYKEAEEIFGRLRASAPLDPRSLLWLAESYLAQGRGQEAIALLQAEVAKDQNRSDLRLQVANIALRTGNTGLAIQELNTLIQKYPNDSGLHLRLGLTYHQMGDFKAALESFKRAREKAPDDVNANLKLAQLLEAMGQASQARPLYEQILKIQPDNPVVLNNLAFQLAEGGSDLDQALTLAQRARQKMPENSDIADTLGWIYIKKNLSDEAIKIFQGLVQKNPNNVTWRYHLAMAFYQKGDKLQAKKELDICLKNSPTKDEETRIRDLRAKIG